MGRVRVLYVAGAGRSGSTILHNILGQVDGFCAIGEVRYVWERGLIKNRLCGCGVTFHDCGFWRAVLEEAFGGTGAVDAEALLAATESFRTSHLPLTLWPGLGAARVARLAAYREALERLYRAVQRVSGCEVIVDLSKNPAYGYLLSTLPSLDLSVVHCLRDPRACAYSWSKTGMAFQPGEDDPDPIRRRPPLHSSLHWLSWNLAAELFVRPRVRRFMTVRYESFVEAPRETIAEIAGMAGGRQGDLPFVDAQTALIERPSHSVFGNPVRFRRGRVPIRADDAWRGGLSAWDRAKVVAYTGAFMRHFGYRLRA